MTEERNALKGNQPMVEIIGVGGGGCNAVNFMMHSGIKDATFLVSDMDQSVLNQFPKQHTIQLGTDGLGAGNRPKKLKLNQKNILKNQKYVCRRRPSNIHRVIFRRWMWDGGCTCHR
ncbi:MAG: hypothetical protein HG458_007885 [Prevotella sp.]|nr:hypothetical protein [Prevotella sp.]